MTGTVLILQHEFCPKDLFLSHKDQAKQLEAKPGQLLVFLLEDKATSIKERRKSVQLSQLHDSTSLKVVRLLLVTAAWAFR